MPRARDVNRGDGMVQCPFCKNYFTRLGNHLSRSLDCKIRNEEFKQSLQQESLQQPEAVDFHMHTSASPDFNEDYLPPEIFPPSPMKQASKRARVDTPDVFEDPGSSIEPGSEMAPFEAEHAFKLHPVYEFPDAGKVFAQQQKTLFDENTAKMQRDLPFSPFANAQEWSLVEWLSTAGLSKNSINKLLTTAYVSFTLNLMKIFAYTHVV